MDSGTGPQGTYPPLIYFDTIGIGSLARFLAFLHYRVIEGFGIEMTFTFGTLLFLCPFGRKNGRTNENDNGVKQ